MQSFYLLNEDFGGRAIASISGFMGGPVGSINGLYNVEKEKEARAELARLKGQPVDVSNTPGIGRYAMHGVAGFSPIILGTVANNVAYTRRLQAEKELEDYKKQNNIQPTQNTQPSPTTSLGNTLGIAAGLTGAAGIGLGLYSNYKRLSTGQEQSQPNNIHPTDQTPQTPQPQSQPSDPVELPPVEI